MIRHIHIVSAASFAVACGALVGGSHALGEEAAPPAPSSAVPPVPARVNDDEGTPTDGAAAVVPLVNVEDPCRKSRTCAAGGRCFTEGSKCVARSDQDCKASWACKNLGRMCELDTIGGKCANLSGGGTAMKHDDTETPEVPTGRGLVIAGSILASIGAANLLTSPICLTNVVDPPLQEGCLIASLAVGAGFTVFSVPMLVGGGVQTAHYKDTRPPGVTAVFVAPVPSGATMQLRGEF